MAEDPTVFAIESGNEMLGPVWGDMNCPASWVQAVARHVKQVAPAKLFVDGTYGINATHLSIAEVDIFSDHFYPVDTSKLQAGLTRVASANRTYIAGEYAWNDADDTELTNWFNIIEKSPVAAGDVFWSLFGRNVPKCDVGFPQNATRMRRQCPLAGAMSQFLRLTDAL